MKRICRMCVVVLTALLVLQPMLAMAGSSARLIPAGTVSVLADGKEVNRFKSEMPVPQGLLMACSGNCIVQTQSLQLVAQDKAVFALNEAEKRWDLTVKSGRVDFAMRSEAKPVAFHTPHDVIQAERAIVPASNNGLVRGFVTVTEKGTELSVQEGALQVVSSDGTQLVQPGHSIVLAQATMGSSASKTTSQALGSTGNSTGAGLGGLTTTSMVVGGGAGLLIAGGALGAGLSSDEDNKPVSPF